MKTFKLKNFADLTDFLKGFPASITEAAKEELQPSAEAFADDIRENAKKHSLPVKLSAKATKEAGPALAKQLTSISKEYIDHVQVVPSNDSVKILVSDDKVKGTDLTYKDLGLIYEFGSNAYGVPARPHIRPALAEMETKSKARSEKSIQRVFNKILKGR